MGSFSFNTLRSPTKFSTSDCKLQIRNKNFPYYRPSDSVLDAKKKNNEMIDFIEKPIDGKSMVGDAPSTTPENDEKAELVGCIVRAADGRKAENIVALRVSSVSTLTSFVVVSSIKESIAAQCT